MFDHLVWHERNLIYGDWTSGPNNDGIREIDYSFEPSKQLINNGSIYIHVYATKNKNSLSDESHQQFRGNNNTYCYVQKMVNKFKKIKYQKRHNLLTGETTATAEEIMKAEIMDQEIVSHWHPNLTINFVTDQTNWVHGQVPPPLDESIQFVKGGSAYKPVIHVNDFWNMQRDYQPLNDTVTILQLHLTYQPLSLFKWQLYSAQSMRNKWTSSLIGDTADEDDSDQDTLKETILETNPVLLGMTIFVSILHSIFEFLAFKNGKNFYVWHDRPNQSNFFRGL